MTKEIDEAIKIAEKEIKKQSDEFVIVSVLDAGASYIVNWAIDDGILSDNFPIEVDKETGHTSVFILPSKDNFKKLGKAREVYGTS